MSRLSPRHAFLATSALAVLSATPVPLFAQSTTTTDSNALPEISVTASPIIHRNRRAAQPAPATTEAPPAPAAPDPLAQSFSASTVLDANQLQNQAGGSLGTGGSLGNLLFDKPGISASTYAPGSSRPIIRGLDNFRVRVQEDGTSSMDVSEIGEDHSVPIDTLSATRVEVVRGPASLRYGSQAIGGVVSVDNNRIPLAETPNGLSGWGASAFTSADLGREGSVGFNVRQNNVAIHADAFTRYTEDYRIPGGVQKNTQQRTAGGAVGGTYFFDGGYFGMALTQASALYHIPGIELAQVNNRINLEQTKLLGKGEYRPDSAMIDAIRLWFGATNYKHDEKGYSDEDGLDGVRATFKNREQEARLEVQMAGVSTPFGIWTAAPGVQFNHQQISTAGEAGGLLAPTETFAAAAYMFNELRVNDQLKLQLAGRIDQAHVSGTPALFPGSFDPINGDAIDFAAKRNFTPKSASFGVLQALPYDMVASFTAQYVERAPRSAELFAKGAHDAPGTFEIGNPNLTTEAARSLEIGLRKQTGRWRFDLAAYYTSYQNYIFKRATGLRCDDEFDSCGSGGGTELTQVIYDQRDALFRGAEVSTQFDVGQVWRGTFGVDGQYDYVDARFKDGSFVPRIPPHRLGGGIYYKDDEWYARVGLLHAFDQNRIAADETVTKGYNLLRAEISRTEKTDYASTGLREVRYGIVGTNLLNDDVRNASSFRKDEVLLPGRSVRIFASAKF
jgi:iron complex outermembrane receptor protein